MEQGCDDAPDLTPAMPNERISRLEQTVVFLSISRHNTTSNNTLFIVRVYCIVYPAMSKNQLSAPPHTLQKQHTCTISHDVQTSGISFQNTYTQLVKSIVNNLYHLE